MAEGLSRVEALREELAVRKGPTSFKVGDVITFEKKFSQGGPTYHYVALLAGDGEWYVTGQDRRSHTWDQLLDMLATAQVNHVRVATGWKKV